MKAKLLWLIVFAILLSGCISAPSTRGDVSKLEIGMRQEQVIEVWGQPNDINRTVTKSAIHEQWVYGCRGASPTQIVWVYLYFDNYILTAWQY